MTVRNIVDFLDPFIDYPGVPSTKHPKGKLYRVPSPDRKTGLRLAALAALGSRAAAVAALRARAASGEDLTPDENKQLEFELTPEDMAQLEFDDEQEGDFATRVLGTAQAEMLADGVAYTTVKAIARDAFYVLTSSEDMADLVLRGEALAREAARTAATGRTKAGSSSSRASGATRGRTRSQASTRSSRSRTKPPATA